MMECLDSYSFSAKYVRIDDIVKSTLQKGETQTQKNVLPNTKSKKKHILNPFSYGYLCISFNLHLWSPQSNWLIHFVSCVCCYTHFCVWKTFVAKSIFILCCYCFERVFPVMVQIFNNVHYVYLWFQHCKTGKFSTSAYTRLKSEVMTPKSCLTSIKCTAVYTFLFITDYLSNISYLLMSLCSFFLLDFLFLLPDLHLCCAEI